jgi:hypothetical protein
MLKGILKGLLGRLVGYALFGAGFWWLYQGFQRSNIPLGILGGAMILAGMYVMATSRRISSTAPADDAEGEKEDNPGDSLNGSSQGDKLSP